MARSATHGAAAKQSRAPSHSRKKLDLTGHRYGRLTVIGPAENIGNRTAWKCRCDCGNELVVKSVYLRNGHTQSCGCTRPVADGVAGKSQVLTYVDGTCVETLRGNRVPRSNNSSGVPGVEWIDSRQRWRATLCFKGKRHYLGQFKEFSDAVRARRHAEEEMVLPFLAQYGEKEGRAPFPKLGELMAMCGLITREQLEQALAEQKAQYTPLGRILINMGAIEEDQLNEMLEHQISSFSV